MSSGLPQKVVDQMSNAGLPSTGECPFEPRVVKNRAGGDIIDKQKITKGPKKGKFGYVDVRGRIWVRDRRTGRFRTTGMSRSTAATITFG